MTRNNSWRALMAPVLLALMVPATLSGGPPAVKKIPPEKIPFLCFTQIWDGQFRVGEGHYDPVKKQLTWSLRVKKDGRLGAYEAYIGDGDGVELGTFDVAITPSDKELKAGARLHAVVSVEDITMDEVAKLTIRERRAE